MEPNKDVFQYTYSAKQQEEIEAIRKKYLPPQEDKMEQLRRLDKSATTGDSSLHCGGRGGLSADGRWHVHGHGVDGEPVYPRHCFGAAGHRLGGGGPPRVPACHQKRAGKAGAPHPPADRGAVQAGVRKTRRKTLGSAFASRRKL